jgi:hypothetical protein
MRSLTAHLVNSDSHDRLPFHPGCPMCRQTRLTGAIPDDGLVSPRTQAVLAAGVLAVSATSPVTAAFAAEQDQQREGTAPVAQSGAPDPANSPDFDPGGNATDLPQLAPPVPQTQAPADPGSDDTAAVDQSPATNPDDPVVDSGDGVNATPAQPPAASQTGAPPVAPATATPALPVTPTNETDPGSPIATGAPAPAAAAAPSRPAPRAVRHARSHTRAVRTPHRQTKPVARTKSQAPLLAVVGAATPTAAPPPPMAQVAHARVTHVAGRLAKPGDRTHTVLAGESLWMIATDLLGRDASTAQVAREVHRLWQLNHDLIRTGDPDLLMVGTKLMLQ